MCLGRRIGVFRCRGLALPLAVEEKGQSSSGNEKGGSEERAEDFCRDVAR